MENKTITPELRQQIFRLYSGQRIMMSDSFQNPIDVIPELADYPCFFLMVKPLVSILDEDLATVAKMTFTKVSDNQTKTWRPLVISFLYTNYPISKDAEKVAGEINISPYRLIEAVDFLRSKGYALPAFGFSPDELYDLDIFVYNKELTDENLKFKVEKAGISPNNLRFAKDRVLTFGTSS